MNPEGHIYEGSEEKPVKPEDAARLDGYLKARAEADAEKAKAALLKHLEDRDDEARNPEGGPRDRRTHHA